MIKRASATLVICTLTAGVAVIGLGRSAADTSAGTPAATPAASEMATTPTESPAAVVTIEGFAFGGTTVAGPGETLNINNRDSAPHTLTAGNGAFDSGTIQSGQSATVTLPSKAGTYEFFCSIHPSMVSTITVEA